MDITAGLIQIILEKVYEYINTLECYIRQLPNSGNSIFTTNMGAHVFSMLQVLVSQTHIITFSHKFTWLINMKKSHGVLDQTYNSPSLPIDDTIDQLQVTRGATRYCKC